MSKAPLTDLDWKIIEKLQTDGRTAISQLASQLNRSRSNITEHIEKLQEVGILKCFSIEVDLEKMGFGISAFVKLEASSKSHREIVAAMDETPAVVECHVLTGAKLLLMRVIAKDMPHLRKIVDSFTQYGSTETDVIFATTKTTLKVDNRLRKSLI
ncbi:MAG: Lrp/AsnC family transcriptional regulator [Kangiellaceae bacterium]|nr:Lrp/AsnC family transcriptional regulator [Kangiellaceae bacterium]